jgi:tetratricopeptide (TPR) repeat protein
MRRFGTAALVVILCLVLLSAVSHVGGKETAVLDPRFGEPIVLSPGFHLHLPFLSSVTHYPLEPLKTEGQVKVETRDNLNFQVRYVLQVSVDPSNLIPFHARRAGRPLDAVIRQLSDEMVQKAATFMRADEILGTAQQERWLGALFPPATERGLKAAEIQVTPVEPRVISNAALIYQERNLPNAALELAKLGVQRYPLNPEVLYGLGRVYEYQGKEKEAEDQYLQALLQDPAAREPMGRLLGALLKRKEFDQAKRLLNAALEKNPNSAPHFNWLGVVLQLQAQYDDSEKAFQKAVALDPKNAEYRASLGALALARGNTSAAQDALKEALRLKPNFTLALYNMGIALAMEGKDSESIPFFEQAGRAGPPSVGLLNALAKAYQQTGQTPKAIQALERSLRLQPAQPEKQKLLRQLQSGRPPAPPRKSH